MSGGRKLLIAGMAFALPASMIVAFGEGTAFAGGSKPAPFSGPADGTVHCTGVTWKISMSPPLLATSGPSSASVKGKLSSCSVTGSSHVGETIQKGTVTGTLNGTSGGCGALITGTSAPVSLSITWKGKVGTAKATFDATSVSYPRAAIAGGSNVGFALGGGDGGTVTGSFAGSVVSSSTIFTTTALSALGNGCVHGMKKLSFTQGSFQIP